MRLGCQQEAVTIADRIGKHIENKTQHICLIFILLLVQGLKSSGQTSGH